MKKDSNRNNLIQKQLKIITKKEEKLLKEPNDNYIKNKISPIKDKIEGMVPDKLQSTLELAFQKGFKVVFDKGTAVIEKLIIKKILIWNMILILMLLINIQRERT